MLIVRNRVNTLISSSIHAIMDIISCNALTAFCGFSFDGVFHMVGGITCMIRLVMPLQISMIIGRIKSVPGEPYQSVIFCGQFNTCLSVSLPAPAFALV